MQNDPIANNSTLERLEQAEQLKLSGNHKDALGILESLLIEDPENISALEEIADNELNLENFERAKTAALQAVKLDAKSYTGHYILGFIFSLQEDFDEAAEYLQQSNALKPNNAEILRCLGWVLFNQGQRAQGIVTLERALNLDTDNPLILCDLGVAYVQAQNFRKAKSLFARALDLDPENPRALECVKAVDRLERAVKEV